MAPYGFLLWIILEAVFYLRQLVEGANLYGDPKADKTELAWAPLMLQIHQDKTANRKENRKWAMAPYIRTLKMANDSWQEHH